MRRISQWAIAASFAVSAAVFAQQQGKSSAVEEIERYRQALGDGNPAELWEARGEALWKEARGPKHASLEQCDLGLGPGVVKGRGFSDPRPHGIGPCQDHQDGHEHQQEAPGATPPP